MKIMFHNPLSCGHVNICGDKAAYFGVIIPALQVIQPRFRIVVITPVAERVIRAQCSCQGASRGEQFAPGIVGIFYHASAACVHETHDVALSIAEVEILIAFVVDAQELAGGVVRIELFDLACHLRHEETSVVAEGGGDIVHRLARADALLAIGVACGRAVAGKAQQALALPCEGITPVGQRIADFVVGDALPVVFCHMKAVRNQYYIKRFLELINQYVLKHKR